MVENWTSPVEAELLFENEVPLLADQVSLNPEGYDGDCPVPGPLSWTETLERSIERGYNLDLGFSLGPNVTGSLEAGIPLVGAASLVIGGTTQYRADAGLQWRETSTWRRELGPIDIHCGRELTATTVRTEKAAQATHEYSRFAWVALFWPSFNYCFDAYPTYMSFDYPCMPTTQTARVDDFWGVRSDIEIEQLAPCSCCCQ